MLNLNFTNTNKIYWPEDNYSKGDVIYYYESIAPTILPYLIDRPMVMLRHPDGIKGESFFQKQINIRQTPSWIKTIKVKHLHRSVDYISINNLESLLYIANLGCIELNPFSAHIPNLDNPDYMIIDLDPEDISFNKVIKVAQAIHELLDFLGIEHYCKTSGKRGLHIFVPLGRQVNFKQSQELSFIIALIIMRQMPDLVSLKHRPQERQQRVYIDYLRNSSHQTIASAYSLRPVRYACVSAPLLWQELGPGLDPRDFNIESMPQRIRDYGDIFKPVLKAKINLKTSIAALQDLLKSKT